MHLYLRWPSLYSFGCAEGLHPHHFFQDNYILTFQKRTKKKSEKPFIQQLFHFRLKWCFVCYHLCLLYFTSRQCIHDTLSLFSLSPGNVHDFCLFLLRCSCDLHCLIIILMSFLVRMLVSFPSSLCMISYGKGWPNRMWVECAQFSWESCYNK